MIFSVLKCVGRALVSRGLKALAGWIPLGEVLGELAGEGFAEWRQQKQEAERRAEVQALAQAAAEEIRGQVIQVVEEVAASQPEEIRAAVAAYLNQVPATVRQSLRRPADPSGTSLPPGMALDRPEDLLALLPARLPRFRPGERPIPGVPWVLGELLGVGGFGEVWKAHNPRFPGLTVALKFCLDPAARSRLLQHEAAVVEGVLRQGKHAGIVELRQAYLENDPPCLEYEYVAGGDLVGILRDWRRQGGLPVAVVLQMVQRLAEAVAFAHRFTPPVVHRDLKPANILVQRGTGGIRLKVADFGIGGLAAGAALAASPRRSGGTPWLTSVLRGACTPLYASPQQLRGEPADPRDDIHALGVIWYQLLTGELGNGAPSGRLWARRLRERGLREAAVDLLAACVEPRAEDRLASAAGLAERLAALARDSAPPVVLPAPAAARPAEDELAALVQRTLEHVAQAHEQARQLEAQAHDYAAAVQVLEQIPDHLRDGALYGRVCERRERVDQLEREVREAVARTDLRFLRPVVTALLELQPGREDLRRLLDRLPKPPKPKPEITDAVGIRLRRIAAGAFVMGSPTFETERQPCEGPQHSVEITRPFYLGVYPVTQRQYEAVTGRNPSRFHAGNGGSPEHPVERVSWEDAVALCRLLTERTEVARWGGVYRLPTEAEWEYACRAGTATLFHGGDVLSSREANFNGYYPCGRSARGPYLERTSAVGSYPPNAWGLFDLHGNVWEWCADWFAEDYYRESPEKDPRGPKVGEKRVLRGGAWYYYGWFCRSAFRYRRRPDERLDSAGFRVVLELPTDAE